MRAQELATYGGDPPSAYIIKDGGMEPVVDTQESIPVIDLNILISSSSSKREEEMEKLRSALTIWGTFQVIGHGIPLDEVLKTGKAFFNLSMEEKKKLTIDRDDETVEDSEFEEGYGGENFKENQVLDWMDRLFLIIKPHHQRNLKLWPEKPDNFREVFDECCTKSSTVVSTLYRLMAELLGLEENYFVTKYEFDAIVHARFNYYPPCPKPNLVFGAKSHRDVGGVTIILPDQEVEGLQVLKDGQWIKVPIIPHALTFFVADLMEIISNGIFRSTVHRVVTNSKRERISLALFYNPDFDREIEPAAELMNDTRPRMFKRIHIKDYHELSYKHYLQGKEPVNYAKV